jgi:hypothetical protein
MSIVLPLAQIGAGGLGFVEQIEAPEQAILDEFGIRFELGLQPIVDDFLAGRLVAAVKLRFERQRDRDRRRIAIDKNGAKFRFKAVEHRHIVVVETWNIINIAKRDARAKYDLHVLRWRIFIFEHGLADGITSATLAKVGFRLRFKRLFALDPGRRPDREIPEYVFGFEFRESAGRVRLLLCFVFLLRARRKRVSWSCVDRCRRADARSASNGRLDNPLRSSEAGKAPLA